MISVASPIVLFADSRRPYPHAPSRHHDYGARLQRVGVPIDQAPHRIHLLPNPQLDEPNDAWMPKAAQENQFAEVLVLRDEHPALFVCQSEQRLIRGPRKLAPRRSHIMPKRAQGIPQCP